MANELTLDTLPVEHGKAVQIKLPGNLVVTASYYQRKETRLFDGGGFIVIEMKLNHFAIIGPTESCTAGDMINAIAKYVSNPDTE